MRKYELQRQIVNPLGQYHSARWKGIAISDDIEMSRAACLRPKECRIVDNDTLEVFGCVVQQ
jgi:hypothetical protein